MLKYTHEHIQLVLTIDQTNMGATKLVIRTCVECIVCDDCDIVRQGLFDGMAKTNYMDCGIAIRIESRV